MERLTMQRDGINMLLCDDTVCKIYGNSTCSQVEPCYVLQNAIDRLAAYEATGLSPEEIKERYDHEAARGNFCKDCANLEPYEADTKRCHYWCLEHKAFVYLSDYCSFFEPKEEVTKP